MPKRMKLSHLCRQAQIDRAAVDTWVSDGYLTLTHAPRNGATRELTRTDALRILTFSAARGCGMSRDIAGRLSAAIGDGPEAEVGVTSIAMPARGVAGTLVGTAARVTIDLSSIAAALDLVWPRSDGAPPT